MTNYLNAGKEYLHEGRYLRAYVRYRKARALNGKDSRAVYGENKLNAYLTIDEIPAEHRVAWLKSQFPGYRDDPDLLVMIAKLLHRQERFGESRDYIRRALDRDPAYSAAWAFLGRLQYRSDDIEQAVNSYSHAVEHAPRNNMFKIDLALLRRKNGEESKAVDLLRKSLADLGHLERYVEFAIGLMKEGRTAESNFMQKILVDNLSAYLESESEDIAWCLLSREDKICLKKSAAKIGFAHLHYLMSLSLAGEEAAGQRHTEVVRHNCAGYARMESITGALRKLADDYARQGGYPEERINLAVSVVDGVCR